jgi:hypothetical protein
MKWSASQLPTSKSDYVNLQGAMHNPSRPGFRPSQSESVDFLKVPAADAVFGFETCQE